MSTTKKYGGYYYREIMHNGQGTHAWKKVGPVSFLDVPILPTPNRNAISFLDGVYFADTDTFIPHALVNEKVVTCSFQAMKYKADTPTLKTPMFDSISAQADDETKEFFLTMLGKELAKENSKWLTAPQYFSYPKLK